MGADTVARWRSAGSKQGGEMWDASYAPAGAVLLTIGFFATAATADELQWVLAAGIALLALGLGLAVRHRQDTSKRRDA